MPEDRSSLPGPSGLVRMPYVDRISAARLRSMVGAGVGLVLMLCGTTLIIGLRMALHEGRVPCGGDNVPEGNGFRCFSHIHAGEGTVIAIFSVILAALLCLAGLIIDLQLRRSSND